MWDYVPTETYLCRTRGCIRAVREDCKTSIAWSRVHAIINQGTCSKSGVSGRNLKKLADRHVASRGALILIKVNAARLRSDGYDKTRSSSHLATRKTLQCVLSPSDGYDETRSSSHLATRGTFRCIRSP